MKKIKIIGKTNQEIYVRDEDNDNIEIYSKKLSNLLDAKNVLVLHTTSASIIIRPSDIFAIEIENELITQDTNISKENFETSELPVVMKGELSEDTLTDMSSE